MRRPSKPLLGIATLLALVVVAAGCGSSNKSSSGNTSSGGSGGSGSPSQGSYSNGSAQKGGTYTVGYENSFGFTDNFDPTGEYLGEAWGIMTNLLVRPLIGYQHLAGAAGNKLIGDLAQSVPTPTDNGLTY
ncbi:MAG TPA: hypothetical protein VF190_05705, partial [Rhodothermales bacterium]